MSPTKNFFTFITAEMLNDGLGCTFKSPATGLQTTNVRLTPGPWKSSPYTIPTTLAGYLPSFFFFGEGILRKSVFPGGILPNNRSYKYWIE